MNGSTTHCLAARYWHDCAGIAAACLTMAISAEAQVTRVSLTAANGEANGASRQAAVSADGRFVAFVSSASNLVANDTNGVDDVFVKDRESGAVRRVSVDAGGAQAAAASSEPGISEDGRFVSFTSLASLTPEDTNACAPNEDANGCADVYVRDLEGDVTILASVAPGGTASMRGRGARISGAGRFIVFSSPAQDLASEPVGVRLFIRDLVDHTTVKVPVPGALVASEGIAGGVSADGQVIAFAASHRLLPPHAPCVPSRTNPCSPPPPDGTLRMFVHTRADGRTTEMDALTSNGRELSPFTVLPLDISSDGQTMLFARTDTQRHTGSLYLFDRRSGHVREVSMSSGNGVIDTFFDSSLPPALSRDGRFVAFCAGMRGPTVIDTRVPMKEVIDTPQSMEDRRCLTTLAMSADGRLLFGASDNRALVVDDQNGVSDIFLFNRDADGDGLPSAWETRFGLDPSDARDGTADPDGDGVSNLDEHGRGSHPRGLFVRYFAEGAANAFFRTTIDLFNPGALPSTAVITYLGGDGGASSQLLAVAEAEHRTLVPRVSDVAFMNEAELLDATFSAIIESDQPLVAERSMQWPALAVPYGAHGETASEAPQREWYFAEGATGLYNLYYLLQNPNDADAHVTIKYLQPAPAAPISIDYTVAARSRRTIDVNAQPGLSATEVSAVVTSDLPILTERSQYLSTPQQFWAAGHAGAGVPRPSTDWFVAEGATGFFRLYLLIANPGESDATLRVTYLLPDGTRVEKPHTARKASRLTIDVEGEDPRFAATTMSTMIHSTNDVPVVVERVMWWPSGAPYEASVSAGTTSTATDWAAASVPVATHTGGSPSSYLLIANPSDQAGNVSVALRGRDGFSCSTTREILAHSRTTIDVGEICRSDAPGDGPTQNLTAIVRSDGPPIVAERATYYSLIEGAGPDQRIELWVAGEALALTKIAPPQP